MIEAAMIWNEPNNKSHWDPEIDPGWPRFAEMAITAGKAIGSENPDLPRVLGGMSPIDTHWLRRMEARPAVQEMRARVYKRYGRY